MNLIQAINTYLWVWLETFRGFRRPAVILPFLAFGLIETAALWSSAHFYQMPWGLLWVPLLSWVPGPAALSYPGYFLALPTLTARMDLVLSAVLGALTSGWGMLLFREAFLGSGRSTGGCLGGALRRGWPLVTLGVLVAVATMLATMLLGLVGSTLLRSWLLGSPLRQFALQFLVNALVQAVLLYLPVVLLLSERGLGTAIREGVGFFWRHRIMTCMLVLVPFLLLVPLSLAVSQPGMVAIKFKPELILTLCLSNVAVAALVNLLLTGATVRFFLYRMRQDRPVAAAPQGA